MPSAWLSIQALHADVLEADLTPGIVALERMVDRLDKDHQTARRLCAGLQGIPRLKAWQPPVPTNFAMVEVGELGWSSEDLISRLKAVGVLGIPRPGGRARLVTHRHITAADVDYVVEVTRRLLEEE